MIEIAISVICYENESEVIEFANKLSQQTASKKLMLLVTCNKCSDVNRLREDLNSIDIHSEVYIPNENLGYLNGCLYGLNSLNEDYNWAVISNTDIDFVSNEFFADFFNANYSSLIGCVGPDIVLKMTGKHQNPFELSRPGKRIMKFRKFVYANYMLYRMYYFLSDVKNVIEKRQVLTPKGTVYGIHGSMILLKKTCIDILLKDDIQIFMYGEEHYIAEKLRENNISTYYDTDLKIIHNENQVTGKIANRRKQKWISQAMNFLVERYWK